MGPNSTSQGNCLSFEEIEQAIKATKFFIDYYRLLPDDGDNPYEKNDCDNVCYDTEAEV